MQRVKRIVPGSDPPPEGSPAQGRFWTEVRDAQGVVLHRRSLHDPVPRDVEVFSPDPARSIARVPLEHPRGVFWVVVPVAPEPTMWL